MNRSPRISRRLSHGGFLSGVFVGLLDGHEPAFDGEHRRELKCSTHYTSFFRLSAIFSKRNKDCDCDCDCDCDRDCATATATAILCDSPWL